MKLYTEEQMRSAMYLSAEGDYDTYSQILNQFIPIELPSDEKIENDAKEFVKSHDFSLLTNPNHLANRCFQEGAKWVIEQIKNK